MTRKKKKKTKYLMLSSSTNKMTPLALCLDPSRSIIRSKSSARELRRIFSLIATHMLYSEARPMKRAIPWRT